MVKYSNNVTFPFVHSSVSQTYTVLNVNIDISLIKQGSLAACSVQLEVVIKFFLVIESIYESSGQDVYIERDKYTTLPYVRYANIIHSNHGNGTQPIKVFKKHRVNDHILTFLLYIIAMETLVSCFGLFSATQKKCSLIF